MGAAMAGNGALYMPPVIYPRIPGEGEGTIRVNEEYMARKGIASYLSLDYKVRELLLEALLEKYRGQGLKDTLHNKGLYIRYGESREKPFVKKREEIIDAIGSVAFKRGKFSVPLQEVLAYQRLQKGSFLLTSDGLYSPAELEGYGRGIALRRLGRIDKRGVYGLNGERIWEGKLAAGFAGLAGELIALNRKAGRITVPHPLCREAEAVRKRHMAFLVYRLCAERGFGADWLIRVELTAGQLRVPPGELSDMIGWALGKRKMAGADQRKYFADAFTDTFADDGVSVLENAGLNASADAAAFIAPGIPGYRDILYYDLLAFELFISRTGGKIGRRASYFTGELEYRLGILPASAQSFMECLEKVQRGEKGLQEAARQAGEEERIRYHMAVFEAEVQKNLMGGSANGG